MRLNYIKELDGVRGTAALMVMFFHFFKLISTPDSGLLHFLAKVSVLGQTGVTLFFVLSGFLITRILLDTKGTPFYFKNFYIRRSLRIFPLYYLFLIIYFFFIPLITGGIIEPVKYQGYYWIYLQNFAFTFKWAAPGPNHYWSLAVEEHFYLFWPLIVYYLPLKHLNKIIASIIVLALIIRIVLIVHGYGVFYFTFTNMDALAIGALLSVKERNHGLGSFSVRKFGFIFTILSLFLITSWPFLSNQSYKIVQVIKFPLLAFTYYSFIGLVIAARNSKYTNILFKNKVILYSGKISYGLYVFHPVIFYYYLNNLKSAYIVLDLVICFCIAYLLAMLSFNLFESKLLVFKKSFESSKMVHKESIS